MVYAAAKEDIGKERTKLDELQAELRKLKLQASHIQHLIDHGPESDDEMGYEEDSGILFLGEDSGEGFGPTPELGILFLLKSVHRGFTASIYNAHNCLSKVAGGCGCGERKVGHSLKEGGRQDAGTRLRLPPGYST